jgi:hypothetical protein
LGPNHFPAVAQAYVPHDGVVYKVYTVCSPADDTESPPAHPILCQVVSRSSLELTSQEPGQKAPICFDALHPPAAGGLFPALELGRPIEAPPQPLVQWLALLLHQATGLHLFGFDLIREKASSKYMVIDVNYFPSALSQPHGDVEHKLTTKPFSGCRLYRVRRCSCCHR